MNMLNDTLSTSVISNLRYFSSKQFFIAKHQCYFPFLIILLSVKSAISEDANNGTWNETSSLDNHQIKSAFAVYRLKPIDDQQVRYLHEIYVNSSQVDFWKEPTYPGEQVHVMVKDSLRDSFLDNIEAKNISYAVMIEDVEKKIIQLRESSKKMRAFNWLRDAPNQRIAFNLAKYHSFTDIINYLNALATTYPDRAQIFPIGTTHEGRQIALIKIGKPSTYEKPGIWIDGGIHAREWIAPAVVLYMINQLVVQYDSDPQIKQLVDGIDWYIVPLLNPDGYEYSRSSTHPEIRMWRKNRSPMVCHMWHSGRFSAPRQRCCQGVDLNRNYDWQFGIEGSSTNPCSEIYQGPYAFSEPETRSVRDFITGRNGQIKAFLTMHSYSQIIMYPYGHRVRTYTNDVTDLRNTALQAANALRSMYGTVYVVGTGADTLYPASGGAEDWAKGRMGIKYSYLFELRPEEEIWDGFLLAENQIIPTSRETFEAVRVIAFHTLNMFNPQNTVSAGRTFSAACVDKEPLCSYWAHEGYCANWPIMRRRCAQSCGFCVRAQSRN